MIRMLARDTWAKLAIFIAVLCLFAGMFKFLFEMKYQSIVAARRGELQVAANYLDLQLNYRLTALQLLFANPKIFTMPPAQISEELKRVVQVMGFFNAVLFDVNGQFVAEAVPEKHVGQVYDAGSFRKAANGSPAISGRIIYSDLHHAYISLRVPVADPGGKVKGVLVAGIMLARVGEILKYKVFQDTECFFILDNHANFIAHPLLEKLYPEHGLFGEYRDFFFAHPSGDFIDTDLVDGIEKLYIYTSLEKADWRVVKAIPVSSVYYSVVRAMLRELLLMLLLLTVIGLACRIVRQAQYYRKERENMRLERLKTVSLIAAGLAHEIRNPLTAIKGFVQLAAKRPEQPVPPARLEVILAEIERIERLTKEFQMLARPPRAPQYAPMDLIPVIRDVLMLSDQQAAERGISLSFQVVMADQSQLLGPILVDAEYAPERYFMVLGDEGQFKQVMFNLLRNAVEAIDKEGCVRVTLGKNGHNINVSVKDNGSGICRETLSQIGTPFFTTKDTGTGLGLSVCFSIIQQHGGKIEIHSVAKQGTVVTILLPGLK